MDIFFDFESLKEDQTINELKPKGEKALDYLWTQAWLKASISEEDQKKVETIITVATSLQNNSDIVLVVATKLAGKMIKAMLCGAPKSTTEVVVFDSTLSGKSYAKTIEKLEGKNFSLISVGAGEEDVAFKAAFSCFRKLLIEKYGPAVAAEHIVNIIKDDKGYLAQEASQDDVKIITLPKDLDEAYCGNSEAVLLPLAVAGVDVVNYLEGMRDIIASPLWDKDGSLYGLACALGHNEVVYYQEEVKSVQGWIAEINGNLVYSKPWKLWIYCEKEEADIALPSFPGCSEDGSLNVLLKEQFDKEYEMYKKDANAVMIRVAEVSPYLLGQLNGFMEISFGITEFILNN